MSQLINTYPDDSNYSIRTTLDGVAYLLTFRYSERETCYFVDLFLDDGTPLVMGQKVVCYRSLWQGQRYNTNVPQGAAIAVPASGGVDTEPGIGELGIGRRVALVYFSPSEF